MYTHRPLNGLPTLLELWDVGACTYLQQISTHLRPDQTHPRHYPSSARLLSLLALFGMNIDFRAMRTKLLVEEAADKLIELQPDSETTEAFLEKVVAEVVLRKHEPSERSDAME